MCVSALLQKIDPLPLAVEQQLLPELQQLLVALHQEGRVVPADGLRAADKRAGNKQWQSEVGDEIAVLYSGAYSAKVTTTDAPVRGSTSGSTLNRRSRNTQF